MHIYLNVHGMLEQLRQKADADKTRGPRVSDGERETEWEEGVSSARSWSLVYRMSAKVLCAECLSIGQQGSVERLSWSISMSDKIKFLFQEQSVNRSCWALELDLCVLLSSVNGRSPAGIRGRRLSYRHAPRLPLRLQNTRWKHWSVQWDRLINGHVCQYSVGKRRKM